MLREPAQKPCILVPRLQRTPINTYEFNRFYSRARALSNLDKIQVIREAVRKETSFDPCYISAYRKREFVEARQLFLYFVRENIKESNGKPLSLAKIGLLVDKDHATVLSAQKHVANLFDTDPDFRKVFLNIMKRIQSAFN
jgi:hypothetical protein